MYYLNFLKNFLVLNLNRYSPFSEKIKIGIKVRDPDVFECRILIKIDPSPKRKPKTNKKEGCWVFSKKIIFVLSAKFFL